MGVAIPAGYAQSVFEFSCSGTSHRPTFTMGMNGPPDTTASEIASVCAIAITAVGSLCTAATMILGWSFVGVNTTLETESGPMVGSASASVIGTGAADALPINCALLVNKITTRGGRKGRGRFFLPPFTVAEGGVNNVGTIASGDITALQAKLENFLTGLLTPGFNPVLLHEDGSLPNEIVDLILQPTIATQRRRMR